MRRNMLIAALCVLVVAAIGLLVATSRHADSPVYRTSNVFDALQAGDCQRATRDFSVGLKAKMPAQQLADDWSRMVAENGPFEKLIVTHAVESNTPRAYVCFTCRFQKGVKYGAIAFDPSGCIDMFALCSRPEVIEDVVKQISR